MSDAINNGETQPNTETETLLRQMEQRLSDKIDNKFAEFKTDILSESDVKKMIKQELTVYTPTEPMQQIMQKLVGDGMASINRTVNDFKVDLSHKVGKIEETFTKFSSATEPILGRIRFDLDEVGRQSDENKQAIGIFKANQELLLAEIKAIKALLNGDKDSLLTQQEMMKQDARRMVDDHNQLRDSLMETNKITQDTVSLVNAIMQRENAREIQREKEEKAQQEARKERNAMIERWTLRIIKGTIAGLVALLGSGGGLVVLDAIGKALGG